MKSIITATLVALVLSACSSGVSEETVSSSEASPLVGAPDPIQAKAAADSLFSVRDAVAAGVGSRLGFGSPNELETATIGAGIPVYVVSSSTVRNHRRGTSPRATLGAAKEMLYPVLVDGVVKSTVVMQQNAHGGWDVVTVGRPGLIQAIDQTRGDLAQHGVTAPVAFVRSEELGVHMLAHETGAGLVFTALGNTPTATLSAHESVPAETALARLAEYARQN